MNENTPPSLPDAGPPAEKTPAPAGIAGLGAAVLAGTAASAPPEATEEGASAPTGASRPAETVSPAATPGSAATPGPADPSCRINPRWGSAAAGIAAERCATGRGGGSGHAAPPSGPGEGSGPAHPGGFAPRGGSWVWLPGGFAPERPWSERHPVLFWGGVLLLLLLVFCWGRFSSQFTGARGPSLAVIEVEGMILDATDTVSWIEDVRKDSSCLGAVVRINSPGGAVGPSQEIYAALKRLSESKPVVASMGALGASGGYYVALGADTIFANPSTLTASIGVKMQVPNFEGLMHTLGVSETTLTTGRLKDAGSSWRDMKPEEEAYLRGLIEDMYEEFIAAVARERNLPLADVRPLADGRAMTGRQAHAVRLVDELGDFYAAVETLKERCKAEDDIPLVQAPEKPVSLLVRLMESTMNAFLERKAAAEQPVFLY